MFASSSLCEANTLNDGWLNHGAHKSRDLIMVIKCGIWRNGNQRRKVIKALVLSLRAEQSRCSYWLEFECLKSPFLLSCDKMEAITCYIINILIYGAEFSYCIEVTGYQFTLTVESWPPGLDIKLCFPFLVQNT